jgi:hypothetical protein
MILQLGVMILQLGRMILQLGRMILQLGRMILQLGRITNIEDYLNIYINYGYEYLNDNVYIAPDTRECSGVYHIKYPKMI